MDVRYYVEHPEVFKNESRSQFLKELSGLEAIPTSYHLYVIIVYSLTALLAFIANVVTLLVLCLGRRTSSELKLYLMSLCVSDTLLAVLSAPFTYTMFMYGKWLFAPDFCPVVLSVQVISVFTSVYTLIVIGIDRYYAIVYPMKTENWWKNFPLVTISLVWLSGIGLAAVQYFHSEAVPMVNGNETYYDCRDTWDDDQSRIYTIVMFALTYGVPVLVLAFLYMRMICAVRHRQLNHEPAPALREQTKVVKMLVAVVLAFVLFWTGSQLFVMIAYLVPGVTRFRTRQKYYTYVVSYFVVNWLSMFHSAVNPIIYSFMSQNFRTDLKKLCNRFLGNRPGYFALGWKRNSKASQESTKTFVSGSR